MAEAVEPGYGISMRQQVGVEKKIEGVCAAFVSRAQADPWNRRRDPNHGLRVKILEPPR